jgi:hypothetical protein
VLSCGSFVSLATQIRHEKNSSAEQTTNQTPTLAFILTSALGAQIVPQSALFINTCTANISLYSSNHFMWYKWVGMNELIENGRKKIKRVCYIANN